MLCLYENRHEARDQPCRSDGFSLFVVAGQLGPAMLVYTFFEKFTGGT